MKKVLVLVHLKGATTKLYDDMLKDLATAGQLKLKERPHHFASVKEDEILVVDVWESAEDFAGFGEIMIPIAKAHGVVAEAELYPLYNELD